MPPVPIIAFCCYQIISYFLPSQSLFFFCSSLLNYYLPIVIKLDLSKRQRFLPPDASYLKLNTTRLPLLHTTLKKSEPSSFHQADTGTCTCTKYNCGSTIQEGGCTNVSDLQRHDMQVMILRLLSY